MIKLWIKHKLAETALNTMFNGLIPNFSIDTGYKVGNRLEKLYYIHKRSLYTKHVTLFDCVITYADHTMISVNYSWEVILYKDLNGNDIDSKFSPHYGRHNILLDWIQ